MIVYLYVYFLILDDTSNEALVWVGNTNETDSVLDETDPNPMTTFTLLKAKREPNIAPKPRS